MILWHINEWKNQSLSEILKVIRKTWKKFCVSSCNGKVFTNISLEREIGKIKQKNYNKSFDWSIVTCMHVTHYRNLLLSGKCDLISVRISIPVSSTNFCFMSWFNIPAVLYPVDHNYKFTKLKTSCGIKRLAYPWLSSFPAGIYLLKVNNRNSRTRCEICSKLTIKTPERSFWCLYC